MPIDSQVISYTDEEKVLMDQIMKLPKDYRNIIYLYYYEGYKIKEIADILGKIRTLSVQNYNEAEIS